MVLGRASHFHIGEPVFSRRRYSSLRRPHQHHRSCRRLRWKLRHRRLLIWCHGILHSSLLDVFVSHLLFEMFILVFFLFWRHWKCIFFDWNCELSKTFVFVSKICGLYLKHTRSKIWEIWCPNHSDFLS